MCQCHKWSPTLLTTERPGKYKIFPPTASHLFALQKNVNKTVVPSVDMSNTQDIRMQIDNSGKRGPDWGIMFQSNNSPIIMTLLTRVRQIWKTWAILIWPCAWMCVSVHIIKKLICKTEPRVHESTRQSVLTEWCDQFFHFFNLPDLLIFIGEVQHMLAFWSSASMNMGYQMCYCVCLFVFR